MSLFLDKEQVLASRYPVHRYQYSSSTLPRELPYTTDLDLNTIVQDNI